MKKEFYKKEELNREKSIRLNKYISDCGVCSRRQADKLIEEGKVLVDGKKAVMGMQIVPGQDIQVEGVPIQREEERIVLLYYKPVGIECTANREVKDNIIDAVGYSKRIYPVGRLDKNSEGLILLTNDGELVNPMMKGCTYHEKEYQVAVNKPVTTQFLEKMAKGIYLEELNQTTRPCQIRQTGKCTFQIILTQGLNRQIRRMCKECGYSVSRIKRTRVMNFRVGRLKAGEYRMANEQELRKLQELLGR